MADAVYIYIYNCICGWPRIVSTRHNQPIHDTNQASRFGGYGKLAIVVAMLARAMQLEEIFT